MKNSLHRPNSQNRFHNRFLVALEKFKAANINQYKGVRSLDFAQALRDAAEELEQVEPSEKTLSCGNA